MTDDAAFTAADLSEAEKYDGLGPAYFASRRVMEAVVEGLDAEHMTPVVKKASDELYDRLLETVQDHLWSNAEYNLQGKMYRMVDDCVKALLTGEGWALKRYALAGRYDCEKVREAVAAHIPRELQDARIADLEEDVKRLTSDLRFYRDR